MGFELKQLPHFQLPSPTDKEPAPDVLLDVVPTPTDHSEGFTVDDDDDDDVGPPTTDPERFASSACARAAARATSGSDVKFSRSISA
jgi:hypothetical protein